MDAQLAVLISGAVAVVATVVIFAVLFVRRRAVGSESSLVEAGAFSFLCGLAAGGITLVFLV